MPQCKQFGYKVLIKTLPPRAQRSKQEPELEQKIKALESTSATLQEESVLSNIRKLKLELSNSRKKGPRSSCRGYV